MNVALEVVITALVGGFPIWALMSRDAIERRRHRHEHPEQRALRVLGERRWWS